MKITVVVNNYVPISASKPFIAEHGFSLLLEKNDHKLLLDTGQSDAVVNNLSLLGVHPDALDAVVLSHGHYDHAGGLQYLLQHRTKPLSVYAHPKIFKERYSLAGGSKHYIGIPCSCEELTALGAVWHFAAEPAQIWPDLLFSGQVPRTISYEKGDSKLVVPTDTCGDCQDGIEDDISLYYHTGDGLAVIGGCTHAGMINTLEYGMRLLGEKRLKAWVGGTHLGPVSASQQEQTMQALAEYTPELLATGHCTGIRMLSVLEQRFGTCVKHCYVGRVLNIDEKN